MLVVLFTYKCSFGILPLELQFHIRHDFADIVLWKLTVQIVDLKFVAFLRKILTRICASHIMPLVTGFCFIYGWLPRWMLKVILSIIQVINFLRKFTTSLCCVVWLNQGTEKHVLGKGWHSNYSNSFYTSTGSAKTPINVFTGSQNLEIVAEDRAAWEFLTEQYWSTFVQGAGTWICFHESKYIF